MFDGIYGDHQSTQGDFTTAMVCQDDASRELTKSSSAIWKDAACVLQLGNPDIFRTILWKTLLFSVILGGFAYEFQISYGFPMIVPCLGCFYWTLPTPRKPFWIFWWDHLGPVLRKSLSAPSESSALDFHFARYGCSYVRWIVILLSIFWKGLLCYHFEQRIIPWGSLGFKPRIRLIYHYLSSFDMIAFIACHPNKMMF